MDTRLFDRSQIGGQNSGKEKSKIRTSRQGWLREQKYFFSDVEQEIHYDTITQGPLVAMGAKVSRRIELATKTKVLRPTASEPYQIVNYGLGGTA